MPQNAKPLPCPCCGSTELHVGETGVFYLGIICMACGLRIEREYPDEWPPDTDDIPEEQRSRIVANRLLAEAIAAWNLRQPQSAPKSAPQTPVAVDGDNYTW